MKDDKYYPNQKSTHFFNILHVFFFFLYPGLQLKLENMFSKKHYIRYILLLAT